MIWFLQTFIMLKQLHDILHKIEKSKHNRTPLGIYFRTIEYLHILSKIHGSGRKSKTKMSSYQISGSFEESRIFQLSDQNDPSRFSLHFQQVVTIGVYSKDSIHSNTRSSVDREMVHHPNHPLQLCHQLFRQQGGTLFRLRHVSEKIQRSGQLNHNMKLRNMGFALMGWKFKAAFHKSN